VDQPDRYRIESALIWAPRAMAPFLIMHGTSDPTVGFINGLAFYNALRYNGKKAVRLAYPNEGHHLAGLANQRDLTVRFMEFFLPEGREAGCLRLPGHVGGRAAGCTPSIRL